MVVISVCPIGNFLVMAVPGLDPGICPGHLDWKGAASRDRDHRHKAGDDEESAIPDGMAGPG
ncbi:hypothetical protein DC522_09570 [Microvirga sp. KLBC 81]|nr:hypothetical protein DC522_09570 [Microvirga sp. KLBC 81]